jgi:hypothetical protein
VLRLSWQQAIALGHDLLYAFVMAAGSMLGIASLFWLLGALPHWPSTVISVLATLGALVFMFLVVWAAINGYRVILLILDVMLWRSVRFTGPFGRWVETKPSDEDNSLITSHYVSLGGRRKSISQTLYERLPDVSPATAEYSLVSRTIFSVRDTAGHIVYRHPSYTANS